MRGRIREALALVGALLVFAVLASGRASALSYEDIAGKWCTGAGISQFERLELIIVRSSDGQRFVFPIRRYEFADTTITVFWTRADQTAVSTTYTEFDAARQRMVQAATEDGPRREHYRC